MAFLFDDGEEVRAVGSEAEEAVADGVGGGVEGMVEVGEKGALLIVVGFGSVDRQGLCHGVVEEEVALCHVIAR